MLPASGDPNVLELYVGFSRFEPDRLVLQIAPELVDEVQALLDEHALEHGSVLVASAGQQLWVETVAIVAGGGGGLAALATVINTVISRHKDKRVVLDPDGKIEMQGFSEESIERFLQRRLEEKQANDADRESRGRRHDELD